MPESMIPTITPEPLNPGGPVCTRFARISGTLTFSSPVNGRELSILTTESKATKSSSLPISIKPVATSPATVLVSNPFSFSSSISPVNCTNIFTFGEGTSATSTAKRPSASSSPRSSRVCSRKNFNLGSIFDMELVKLLVLYNYFYSGYSGLVNSMYRTKSFSASMGSFLAGSESVTISPAIVRISAPITFNCDLCSGSKRLIVRMIIVT